MAPLPHLLVVPALLLSVPVTAGKQPQALRFGRAPHGHDLTAAYTYEHYVRDFGGKATEEGRTAFKANMKEILAHNANPHKLYTKGLNERTGSKAPYPRGRAKQPKHAGKDILEKHRKPAPLETLPAVSSLPASVSWLDLMTPVKNQGSCGSCWAFSTTQVLEAYFKMNTGLTSDLAVQQIMTCTPNPDDCGGYGGCSGGVEPQGFAYVADMSASGGGLLTEWMLPYESFYGIGNTTQMIMAADDDLKNPKMNVSTCDFLVPTMAPLALVTVDGYVRLPENNATALMSALATVGPLTISVDASTWSSYEGGVYDGCSYDDMDMDHAVTLVGYGTDETSGADYWLVRNSWGPTWGEGGYIRLKRDPVDDTPCGVDTQPFDGSSCWADKDTTVYPCGQCGIAFDVSYPTGVSLKTASSSA